MPHIFFQNIQKRDMGKTSRKAKDPSAPKPPLNSYMEFAREERPRVLSDLGNIPTTEVGKEIGARWKKLPKEERLKFESRFRENLESYRVEKVNYEKISSKPQSAPSAQLKKRKDPKSPKLPLTSYMEFAKVERQKVLADLGSIPLGEVGKELGRRWRELCKEEKETFEIKSKENRANYVKEKKRFAESRISEQERSTPGQSMVTSEPPPQDQPSSSGSDSLPFQAVLCPAGTLPSSSQSDNIELRDLGFAKQKGFPWHPALKTGTLARGTRVTVTFFGTGQSGTVDKSSWLVYSEQAETKVTTPKLRKAAAFRTGLGQMKNLRDKLLSGPVTSAGITFTPQPGGRRFRSLNKDLLQKEEEENMRLMEKKMRQEDGTMIWTCRDCSWKGKFSHKAKAHARDCGQRKRVNIKKNKVKKFECSNGSCELSFALRGQLLEHYRYLFIY